MLFRYSPRLISRNRSSEAMASTCCAVCRLYPERKRFHHYNNVANIGKEKCNSNYASKINSTSTNKKMQFSLKNRFLVIFRLLDEKYLLVHKTLQLEVRHC